MKCIRYSLLASMMALMPAASMAAKVNIPHEGGYQFDFCSIGEFKAMSSGDNVFVSHYRVTANTKAPVGGKAFDRMSALCYGVYTRLNGRHQEKGVCELTDADGDKWWMDYQGNADGSGGTYTAAAGIGKYEGITVNGGYTLDFWPSVSKDVVQACNPNKGTYKLR